MSRVLLLGLACLFLQTGALSQESGSEEAEKALALRDLPEAVRAAVRRLARGGEIEEIEVEIENGHRVYAVEVEGEDDSETSYLLGAGGELLEVETEIHPLTLPSSVRKAIENRFGKARVAEAAWIREHFYEIEFGGEGEDDEVRIHANGMPLEDQARRARFSRLPAAVRAAIARHLGDGEVREIEWSSSRLEDVYEIELALGGAAVSMSVTASGDLLKTEKEVVPGSLPLAVAEGLRKAHPGRAPLEVEWVTTYAYELEVVLGDRSWEVEVTPAGEILEIESATGDDDSADDDDDEEDDEEEDDEDGDEDGGEEDHDEDGGRR